MKPQNRTGPYWHRARYTGIVDETNRIVLGGAENIIGWENIDVASLLEEQMKLPVVVGNDANLMGLEKRNMVQEEVHSWCF